MSEDWFSKYENEEELTLRDGGFMVKMWSGLAIALAFLQLIA